MPISYFPRTHPEAKLLYQVHDFEKTRSTDSQVDASTGPKPSVTRESWQKDAIFRAPASPRSHEQAQNWAIHRCNAFDEDSDDEDC